SPLFDQNHRIIGQLYGGASACAGSVNNGLFDYYGRFGVSWDAGSTASTRLKDWLDPGNTGVSILDGWPEGFEALNYDAGVSSVEGLPSTLCGQSIYPEVVIYNYGTTTLNSATVHYKLNGGAEQTLDWTGSIAQYGNATVDLPVLTAIEGNNDLQVWITDPNGVADENPNNNNIEVTFVALTGDVAGFSMQLLTDDFPEETTWAITDENLNILYSGGPYNAAGDLMVIDGCLPEGCYTLTVFDSYGDGICCVWGNGNYELQDADGNVLAAGAEFGNADINTFCIEVVTGIGTSDGPQSIAAWPNPANASIGFYGVSGINLEVKLFDVSARLVQRSTS
ncbi:MAG: secretion system protein Por, partial [Flavobacteriales bacterium]|nr:secretion system protein Por [Flavobacteriales bacterium]